MLPDSTLVLSFFIILGAGLSAGFINAIVGSGTLISFPLLLLLGYPPLTANISSSVGLVAGNISGAYGYRREIRQNSGLIKMLLPSSILGGITGASLLLILPESAFAFVVPVLVGLGLIMVVGGPKIQQRVAAARSHDTNAQEILGTTPEPALPPGQKTAGSHPGNRYCSAHQSATELEDYFRIR